MNPKNLPSSAPSALSVGERRAQVREDSNEELHLTIETASLDGVTENVSGIGVLFFTEGDLRVSVDMKEGGVRTTRKGRLVRVQRMSMDNTGFAVEFDPE